MDLNLKTATYAS